MAITKRARKEPPRRTKKGPEELRILSYNIHQGITARRRKLALSILKDAIKTLGADVVILQEVAASFRPKKGEETALAHQLEQLADEIWPYHAYQKNSAFHGGFHGNAILSRYPILRSEKLNITVPGLQTRGAIHAVLDYPSPNGELHVLGVHLGLLQYERKRQIRKLCQYIRTHVSAGTRLVIGGDFNDWREFVSKSLAENLRVQEAFLTQDAKHARTFPSRMPLLRLDRIYFRGFFLREACVLTGRPWKHLSDHLPVLATLKKI